MPKKGGDSYVSTVRGLDIGLELLKDVEKIGARETSIPRSTAEEFEEAGDAEQETWKAEGCDHPLQGDEESLH